MSISTFKASKGMELPRAYNAIHMINALDKINIALPRDHYRQRFSVRGRLV